MPGGYVTTGTNIVRKDVFNKRRHRVLRDVFRPAKRGMEILNVEFPPALWARCYDRRHAPHQVEQLVEVVARCGCPRCPRGRRLQNGQEPRDQPAVRLDHARNADRCRLAAPRARPRRLQGQHALLGRHPLRGKKGGVRLHASRPHHAYGDRDRDGNDEGGHQAAPAAPRDRGGHQRHRQSDGVAPVKILAPPQKEREVVVAKLPGVTLVSSRSSHARSILEQK